MPGKKKRRDFDAVAVVIDQQNPRQLCIRAHVVLEPINSPAWQDCTRALAQLLSPSNFCNTAIAAIHAVLSMGRETMRGRGSVSKSNQPSPVMSMMIAAGFNPLAIDSRRA